MPVEDCGTSILPHGRGDETVIAVVNDVGVLTCGTRAKLTELIVCGMIETACLISSGKIAVGGPLFVGVKANGNKVKLAGPVPFGTNVGRQTKGWNMPAVNDVGVVRTGGGGINV